MKTKKQINDLLQLIPSPVRGFIGTACICAFALFLLGGPLSLRAAAFDNTINPYAGDPAVQALVSGESAYRSATTAENGELIVDGHRTHIWPGTGTTKRWLAGLTIGNDTFVAQEGQFRLYRNRKLVDYTECALEYRWYSNYDYTITAGDDGTVYLYDYHSVQTWDRTTGTFRNVIEKTAYCTDFFEDTGWAFVYEEENDPDTAYDNVVHVLNSKAGIDRVLAEHAIDLGGFNGFIEVRFFVNADENHPAKEKNTIGWAFDHYTALHKFASAGETDWWDEYSDHDVQRRLDEGTWYDPIPHRRWGSTGSGLFPSAYED